MVQDDLPIRPLSAALRKKAEEELNETPEKIVTHLKILQDWIKTQPHLHRIMPTNQWLIAFLRGCKYDIEKAKKKVDEYYKNKAIITELYGNRDPFDPNIQKILELGVFLPLQKTSKEDDARICISRSGVFSTSKLPLTDLIKVTFMIIEILFIEDDNFTIGGEDCIADLEGMAFGFLLQWTPSLAKKVMTCSEKALSIRFKSLHFLNPLYGLSTAVAIFKMFLGAKMKNRIFTHNKDSLYDHVSRSILPEEYGGTEGTVQELTANQWLIAFLRGCKYDIEKAKKKIDVYYTNKTTITELYGNRDPFDPNIQKILELGIFLPVLKTSKDDDARLCISRPGVFSKSKLPLTDLIKVSLMIIEILLLEDDNFTIGGEDALTDLEGMPFGFLFQWTPSLAKKMITCLENALSIRLKCLHVLNPLYGLSTAVAILKMFLRSKMKNRIIIHNKDSLYDHVSRSILPEEYGGTEGTVQELIDHWKEKVESYREWFIEENSSSDESMRPKPVGGFFS